MVNLVALNYITVCKEVIWFENFCVHFQLEYQIEFWDVIKNLNSIRFKKRSDQGWYHILIYLLFRIRYPKEIMKMEQHFSTLQRWLQK